jgi:long-chain acyl-CoA synthetase
MQSVSGRTKAPRGKAAPQAGTEGHWRGFAEFLRERAQRYGDRTALAWSDVTGRRSGRFSYRELHGSALRLAARLEAMGVVPGDRVALLSESRPEWGAAFFGIQIAGAVLVPLDAKATLAELGAIVMDCRPVLILASRACAEMAAGLRARDIGILELESLRKDPFPTPISAETAFPTPREPAHSLPPEPGISPGPFPDKRRADLALIVYTSGTTGTAKGALITVGNLLFQIEAQMQGFGITPDDRFLSILPLNHLFELTCGMLGVIHAGARAYYCRSLLPSDVTKALRRRKVTYMIAVPFFLRLVAKQMRTAVEAKGPWRRALFSAWRVLAPWLPAAARRRVFRPVQEALGGHLRAFISGGAPLDAATEDFLARLGVVVFQGYGLTETSPVISANRPDGARAGTVGRPWPGIEVRIVPVDAEGEDAKGEDVIASGFGKDNGRRQEGEIRTRGPHVMAGYHGRTDLTAEAFDAEGWFRTGDLGCLDADGFLRITGRIKSLIVLEGGKKIHPEEPEESLARLDWVKEACVVAMTGADGKEEVVAVIVPQADWPPRKAADAEIDAALADLSPWKRPARIFYSGQELPRTATRKVRREAVKAMLATMGAEGMAWPRT